MENAASTNPNLVVDHDIVTPRFSVQNADEFRQGIEYLNEHGYAVFGNVLSDNDEIARNVDLLWKHLESLERPYNIRRNDVTTWNMWPGMNHIGLLQDYGIGHSEFMWAVRGNPNVKKVFAGIWETPELLVSFDGAGCFRDWHFNPKWKTISGWYHCDQNPYDKPNRCSIQGFVAMTDNNEFTGGLVVLPDSHKHFTELKSLVSKKRQVGDYVSVPRDHTLIEELRPRLVKCQAGDLVVWDSRCIHCNTPALAEKTAVSNLDHQTPQLLRIVAYVCMVPTSLFIPDMIEYKTLDEFRRLRQEYVENKVTCTHWPYELRINGWPQAINKTPLELTAHQQSLVLGTHVESEEKKELVCND